ncbi:MAG: AraC family transcriptional regulator [Verrucomicrobiales bacterium]|nr:AraC family transcriptional regulator [Verrucomicrobiales bacterium]
MATEPNACFFVKDTESRYVMCNRFHLVTYDLSRQEDLVGKAARDYFPALLAEAYEANDRSVFESGKSIWNEIWLVPHIRGTPRWFVSSKAPLFDLKGDIMGLAGLMHPIATPEDQRNHFGELQRVIEFLDTHFIDEIDATNLAEIAGLSVPHFNRRFRKLLRLSPMEYVLNLRIQEAQRLLTTTDSSIGEIAAATGFYDQSHFTKRFKKITGITPLRYRREFR